MIDSITLKNFKKHTNLDLMFDDGVTSLVGANAAGKSSVLKGMLMALFGATAAGAKDNLWNWYSEGDRSVSLGITLPEYGRVQVIRSPSGAQVMDPSGRVLASGNTAVTKLIEESLGMLAKDLKTLMYSPQGETQGLLTMGPAALQGRVESLAHIDVIDKVLDKAGTDVTRLEGRLEQINMPDNLDEVRKRIEDLALAIEYYDREMRGAANLSNQLKEGLEAKQAEVRAAYQLNVDIQRVSGDVRSITSAIDSISSSIAGINVELCNTPDIDDAACEGMAAQIAALSEEAAKLRMESSAISNAKLRVSALTGRRERLIKEVSTHNDAVVELAGTQGVLKFKQDQLLDLNKQSDKISAEIGQVKAMLHNATCPTCKRPMENINPEALQSQLNDLMAQYSVPYDQAVMLRAELNELGVQERQWLDLLSPQSELSLRNTEEELRNIDSYSQEYVDNLDVQIKQAEAAIRDLQEQLAQQNVYRSTRRRLTQELDRHNANLLTYQSNLIEAQGWLHGKEIVDVKHLEAEASLMAAQQQEAVAAYNDWRNKCITGEQERRGLERELAAGEAVKQEYQEATESKSKIENLQKYLRKNRARFADDIWGGLLSYASGLVSNTTGGVLSDLSRSNDGGFMVTENGRQVPVVESSGAQRSIIGLALRIAMTKVFFGEDLPLLLDEVSSDASDETAAMISGMLASLDMQVISVSHRQGDSVNAGAVVEVGR